ncbi:TetR family transcriptional regulator [Micromonospora sp. CPCC 205371]|nr:TetR family transcriptional regulator [Micromonospora sp. CPCC 205371]
MQHGNPIPVRERTRRAMRAELTLLAQDLFAEKGYDQTTIDDLVAAAGMSKRTFFRYFTSKEDLVLGKYELLADRLIEALAARPHDEPVWESLRRAFDVIVEYFDGEQNLPRTLAMEKIIRGNPALGAGELERISRAQQQLADLVRERTGLHSPADPAPAAIAGAALSCLLAAKTTWIATGQSRPLAELLDEAMAALRPAEESHTP